MWLFQCARVFCPWASLRCLPVWLPVWLPTWRTTARPHPPQGGDRVLSSAEAKDLFGYGVAPA